MRSRTLLSQVLAVNTVLVAITAFVAALIARDRLEDAASIEGLLLISLAVFIVVLLNSILLRRRLEPMGRLVDTMSRVDLTTSSWRFVAAPWYATKGVCSTASRVICKRYAQGFWRSPTMRVICGFFAS